MQRAWGTVRVVFEHFKPLGSKRNQRRQGEVSSGLAVVRRSVLLHMVCELRLDCNLFKESQLVMLLLGIYIYLLHVASQLSALPGCDVETSILLGTEPHSGECQFAIALCNVDDEATVAGIQVHRLLFKEDADPCGDY